MKHELRRVDPLRAANIGALVYGLLLSAFALIFSPFVLIFAVLAPSDEGPLGGAVVAMVMLVLYPILGVVMGWISGALTCLIYNLVIRWTGGLLFEFDSRPAETVVS